MQNIQFFVLLVRYKSNKICRVYFVYGKNQFFVLVHHSIHSIVVQYTYSFSFFNISIAITRVLSQSENVTSVEDILVIC